MKIAALVVALVAAASPVVAEADMPKIIAIRQMGNMTGPTTVTSTSSRSTSTQISTVTNPNGGAGNGGGGGNGMSGNSANDLGVHGSAIGASAMALAGIIGALAFGL